MADDSSDDTTNKVLDELIEQFVKRIGLVTSSVDIDDNVRERGYKILEEFRELLCDVFDGTAWEDFARESFEKGKSQLIENKKEIGKIITGNASSLVQTARNHVDTDSQLLITQLTNQVSESTAGFVTLHTSGDHTATAASSLYQKVDFNVIEDTLKSFRQSELTKTVLREGVKLLQSWHSNNPLISNQITNFEYYSLVQMMKEKYENEAEKSQLLSTMKSEILRLLTSYVPTHKIDPVSGTKDGIKYHIENLCLEEFSIQESGIQLTINNMNNIKRHQPWIVVTLKKMDAALHNVAWHVEQEYFPHLSGDGVADCHLSDCEVFVGIHVAKENTESLVLLAESVNVRIGNLTFEIKNSGYNWILNNFAGIFSTRLRVYIQNLVQESLMEYLNDTANSLNQAIQYMYQSSRDWITLDIDRLPSQSATRVAIYEARLKSICGGRRDLYSVEFRDPGPIGMSFEQVGEYVAVKKFFRGTNDELLPAEQGGDINIGDILAGYNGQEIVSLPLEKVMHRLKSASRPLFFSFIPRIPVANAASSRSSLTTITFTEAQMYLVIISKWEGDNDRKASNEFAAIVKGFRKRSDGTHGPAYGHVELGMMLVKIESESVLGKSFRETLDALRRYNTRPLTVSFSHSPDYEVQFPISKPTDMILETFENGITVVSGFESSIGAAEKQAPESLTKGKVIKLVNRKQAPSGQFKTVVNMMKTEPRPMTIAFGPEDATDTVDTELTFHEGPLGMIFYQTPHGNMAFKHFSKPPGPAQATKKIFVGDALVTVNGASVTDPQSAIAEASLPLVLGFRNMDLYEKLK